MGRGALALALLVGGCGSGWTYRPPDESFQVTMGTSVRYAPIKGFVQIPKGGAADTTSESRPTLDELGITDSIQPEVDLAIGWAGHTLTLQARFVRLSGRATLDQALVTHGSTYPPGSSVGADIRLDEYRLGYEYPFVWSNGESSVRLVPGAGIGLLSTGYSIGSSAEPSPFSQLNLPSESRQLNFFYPWVALASEWRPGGAFSITGRVVASLPFSDERELFSVDVAVGYDLWESGTLFIGVGAERLDMRDGQSTPNQVRTVAGPSGFLGLEIRF